MNDEPSTSGAGSTDQEQASTGNGQASQAQVRSRRERNRRLYNRKKGEALDDLLRALDILTYIEMSAIYYMDNASLRLFFRVAVQFIYLTPKPPVWPDPPKQRRFLAAILAINIICAFLHLFVAVPEAGEVTRGYLHGGLWLDFVGQRSPASKIRLIIMDLVTLGLEVVMYAASIARRHIKDHPAGDSAVPSQSSSAERIGSTSAQDHDHEERGLLREATGINDPMEMRPITSESRSSVLQDASGRDGAAERSELLNSASSPPAEVHVFDAFNSGQMMITEIYLLDTVRDGMKATGERAGNTTSSIVEQLPGARFRIQYRIGRPSRHHP